MRNLHELVLAVAVLVSTSCLVFSAKKSSGDDGIAKLNSLCASIGEIKYISKMQDLIDLVNQFSLDDLCSTSQVNCFGAFPSYNAGAQCLEQKESLLALKPLLDEDENVCKETHINLISEYREKFILNRADGPEPIVASFFNLYADQVSMSCKRMMLHSLNKADASFIDEEDYRKALPWLPVIDSCKHDALSPTIPDSHKDDEYNHCDAILTLSNLESMNELVEAISSEEDDETGSAESTTNSTTSEYVGVKYRSGVIKRVHSKFILMVSDADMRQTVQGMLEACSKLEIVYKHTILPVVRLAQMGYNSQFDNFDKSCKKEPLIHKWLTITLVCYSLMGSKIIDGKTITSEPVPHNLDAVKMIVLDEDETIDHISLAVEESNFVSSLEYKLEDKLWVYKLRAGKYGKSNFVQKVVQRLKLDRLPQRFIFSKKAKNRRSLFMRIVFVGLSLISISH